MYHSESAVKNRTSDQDLRKENNTKNGINKTKEGYYQLHPSSTSDFYSLPSNITRIWAC